jgi:diadenosine tetraphosphate (Ap4A) HIT family hydrolase
MTTLTSPTSCVICDQEYAEDRSVIFRDDLWACEICPGAEVPGWVVVRTRRHVIGWPGLGPDEQATIGTRVGHLVSAMREVTGAPAVYVLTFGEANPHFHALVAARGDDVPPERRQAGILGLRADRLDREAAHELVPAIRAAYARLAVA